MYGGSTWGIKAYPVETWSRYTYWSMTRNTKDLVTANSYWVIIRGLKEKLPFLVENNI